ncbi:MAG: 4-diphosphocytidyl-2C-methyl-D-erythritol kinase [Deltaproteobacteria bacterium]|nr:MAG: 4-diphosphocytidyl-2C-methyl-D-erythritol kinase [Deltaproteobacteria bacterium]TMQ20774.1 MAG: 4-diphosphocytidyl-2C-methyl-D-erythritol kinase [Deltaproteobacteria bacterium]
MTFGAVAVRDAVGAVLAHTLRAGDRVLKKGRVLSASDVEALAASGHAEVVCVRLEPGELAEDAAASRIAAALAGAGTRLERAHTGRTNLHAAVDGLTVVDRDAIARGNAIDEAITVATVPALAPVRAGEMVATVKIIPFGAREAAVAAAAEAVRGAIAVQAWRGCRGGLVLTRFADTAQVLLDRATAAQRTRLERFGGALAGTLVVAHDAAAVASAIAQHARDGLDPILVLGASAIMDRRDVIPAGLERAGGEIVRLGMPVDPGNLLLLGRLGARSVIGVPGCARSLKPSGFDWVLQRICAGIPVAAGDVAAMGVGGLLDEITVRPSPREPEADRGERGEAAGDRIAAVVLAAGRASRMGSNKLVAELDGEPIVRRTVRAALASAARPVIVVTGHEADAVRAALAGLDVQLVHNPDFAEGMSTSLRTGIAAAGAVRAALVCLGDMPRLEARHLDAVIEAFRAGDPDEIIVPTADRKRGNPVLWPHRYFAEIAELTGDVGARALIDRHADQVRLLAIDDPAILVDVDTPAALAELRTGRAPDTRR